MPFLWREDFRPVPVSLPNLQTAYTNMPSHPARTPRLLNGRAWLFAPVLALLLAAGSAPAIDFNATKGIWKLVYGVTDSQINETGANTGWLSRDDDGDGISNGAEIAAGTNPFNPGSAVKVTSVTADVSNVHLTFPTANKKQYVVQKNSDPTLAPASWAAVVPTVQVTGDGTSKTLDVPRGGSNTFYRVVVQDIDSDGDGVSDWAEVIANLNPNAAETNTGVNDGTYVTAQLALPAEVNITATTPIASEDGPTVGGFTITRTQTMLPITVNLSTTGSTATAGSNYSALPSSIDLPVGTTTIQIPVAPIQNPLVQGSKSVKATLVPPTPGSAGFTVGSHNSATVIINDSTTASGTGLYARYYDTANGTYADVLNFGQTGGTYTYTRNGASPYTGSTITIPFTYNGSPALQVGHLVKIDMTSGSLSGQATWDNVVHTVSAVNPGVSFTVQVSGSGLPASGSGNCNFRIESFPHPPALQRVDSTVNFDWQHGTPNGVTITEVSGLTNRPDNYSDTFETYLVPPTTGAYFFQLDADDKAQVLLDTGSGLVQIVEHNWTTPGSDPVGTFKLSGSVALTANQHYKMRVEHVETTGDARCRLQWKVPGSTSFANIPQANQFTHTQAATYNFTKTTTTSGTATITLAGHGLNNGDLVAIDFSGGNLFTPNASDTAGYSGNYTVSNAAVSTFDVAISGTNLPASQTNQSCLLENRPASTTAGVLNKTYANTSFSNTPGRIGIDAAVTTGNNGIWGAGSPDAVLINPDTFSVRWTGQVQPQFTEEYTFVVQADDSCALWINGQQQVLKMAPSASTGNASYSYDATTGDVTVDYTNLIAAANSFVNGEIVRLDWTNNNLNHNPASPLTYTYNPTTNKIEVDYTNLTTGAANSGANRVAGSYAVGETVEVDPTSGSVSSLSTLPYVIESVSGNKFTIDAGSLNFNPTINVQSIATGVNCTITTATPHNLSVGQQVKITGVSGGTFTPAINDFFTVVSVPSNVAFTVGSNCSVVPTVGTGTIAAGGTITVNDVRNVTISPLSATATTFKVNIGAGRYPNGSTGNVSIDLANKPLKDWVSNGNERYVRIPMVGGVRYDIQLDMWESSSAARCFLSWYSPSQPKQIIPAERLYPSGGTLAPAAYIGSNDASGMVGGTFSQAIPGSNGASVTLGADTPAWLSYNNGAISGTPPSGAAGDYQITVTVTNSTGTSTSVLNLHIDENAGSVVHDRWDGIAGTSVASIPTTTNPSFTENVSALETNASIDNYGERLRGYITAPATGNYYFWIAANSPAELWISNDDDTINAFKRAWVATGNATAQNWSAETSQKSPWLALEQGKKYYFEVLHKAAAGSGDNLAIGWAKPGDATTAPSQVVPGYVLSPYVAPAANSTPGTLYVASLLAQPGAVTNGVGTSTLRLSPDETVAYMRYSYSNLTGPITSQHIHIDPNPGHNDGEIVYDIDNPTQGGTPGDGIITNPADPNYGAYKWTIASHGTYTGPQILEAIKDGKAYINLHTNAYLNGEIRGNYTLANGTRTFSPPSNPASWTDDGNTDAGAVRFLSQATFGANTADIAALKGLIATGGDGAPAVNRPASRYETWIDQQFAKSATHHLPEVLAREIADVFGPFDVKVCFDTWWKTSMTADDQLRQRVAFALSQIHVVSGQGPLEDNSRAIADHYDTLADNAFGNFRDVLVGTTLTPAMGRYLDMLGNDKPDLAIGRSPNENYAREIKQLFSIGLYRMWPDGTLMLSQQDAPIDTYTQREIVGLAHVFTGWYYGYDGDYRTAMNATADWTRPMREVPARHFTGTKRLLNNEVFPGLPTLNGQTLDPYATHTSNQYTDPVYEALPAQELSAAHDMLFNHPNTGPFICRQLIQRMVTSNPSRDYLYRVVQKFNDNGLGVRGDMQAVIKAILLDYEARSTAMLSIPAYGKQREPIMRVAQAARALRPANAFGPISYSQTPAMINTSGVPYILITTTGTHPYVGSNVVFMEFTDGSGSATPSTGTYTVLSNPAPTGTTFAVAAPGWMAGTYTWNNNSTVTITMNGHNLPGDNANASPAQVLAQENKGIAYFDFTSGSLNGSAIDQATSTTLTSTAYDIASGVGNTLTLPAVNGNYGGSTFTIAGPAGGAGQTGNVMISRFGGTYSCTGRAGVITIDTVYGGAGTFGTMADHGLTVGSKVFINFTNSRDTTSGVETSTLNDLEYTITNVPDANTFTVTARDATNAAMNSDNQAVVFPYIPQPLTRSGSVIMRQGTYLMDNTDSDLAQTPLNSPTVFNFFLPDYKFAGTLASQGITTPEFQLTAQTTAVRQANFIYNGIFNPSNNTSIAGFYNSSIGGNGLALVMDLSPWLGNATNSVLGDGAQTGQAWTSNQNLDSLIDRMDTLLSGNQVGATTKAVIKKFLFRQITIGAIGSPVTITCASHGLVAGDTVVISGTTGGTFSGASTSLNGTFLVGANPAANTFTLTATSSPFTALNCTSVASLNTTNANAHLSPVSYNNASPSATEKANRLRAILHLILTSPDFTIQR